MKKGLSNIVLVGLGFLVGALAWSTYLAVTIGIVLVLRRSHTNVSTQRNTRKTGGK